MATLVAARRVTPAVLAVGDGTVLLLWAVLGLAHHAEGITVAGLLRTAGPILLGWFAAAAVLLTYRRSSSVRRFLATWALGISAGVVLRALFLGRTWNADEFAFFGVTLGVTLVLLLIWRGFVAAWTRVPARTSASR
jgi:Protein of unknown function (DUF3054)